MPEYTILVIDYDPRWLEQLLPALTRGGYHVETAPDGISGIRRFKTVRPDLTLIEFMLPKKTGLVVCKELRALETGQGSALVVMSSKFRAQQHRNVVRYQCKVDGFLEKPFSDETLLTTVADALKRKGRTRKPQAETSAAPPAEETPAASPAAPTAAPTAAPLAAAGPTPAAASPPSGAQAAQGTRSESHAAVATEPATPREVAIDSMLELAIPPADPAAPVDPAPRGDAEDGASRPPSDLECEVADQLDSILGNF